jgi:glutathione S-transferase
MVTAMKLYGTTTSPFVRRVRVVAAEVGEPLERVETATDEGQGQLRAISPIRKVPVAMIDERMIYDSRAIIDYLTLTRGYGGIEPPRDQWREQNLVNAVDAALGSATASRSTARRTRRASSSAPTRCSRGSPGSSRRIAARSRRGSGWPSCR